MRTPYSSEDTWQVSVSGIFEFSISAVLGFTVLTILLSTGTLFLWLATATYWRARLAVVVDEAEKEQELTNNHVHPGRGSGA